MNIWEDDIMENRIVKKALSDAVGLCNFFTKSYFEMDEWMRIYAATPMKDYFKQDAHLGGHVSHQTNPKKKHLQKRYYFV